jgi:hypothetical protein
MRSQQAVNFWLDRMAAFLGAVYIKDGAVTVRFHQSVRPQDVQAFASVQKQYPDALVVPGRVNDLFLLTVIP